MSRRWRLAAVMALCAAALPLLQAPAGAAPVAGRGADPAVAAALQRIGAQQQTPADLALIRSQPELAAKVMDPGRTKVDVELSPQLKDVRAGITAEGCGWYSVTITAETLLGFDLWKWKHHIDLCVDGTSVTRWRERYDQLMYADLTVYARELTADSATPTPASSVWSTKQRHLEQCVVSYGCYANWYPWSQMLVWSSGSWGYRWGVG